MFKLFREIKSIGCNALFNYFHCKAFLNSTFFQGVVVLGHLCCMLCVTYSPGFSIFMLNYFFRVSVIEMLSISIYRR